MKLNNVFSANSKKPLKKILDSPGQYTQITAGTELSGYSAEDQQNITSKTGFSSIVAICFTINYIMGTGFLALPWAFVEGGLILSSIALFLIAVIADVSKDFLLETMARAEALESLDHQNDNKIDDIIQIRHLEGGRRSVDLECMSPLSVMGDDVIDQDEEKSSKEKNMSDKYKSMDDIDPGRSYGSLSQQQKMAFQQKNTVQFSKKRRRYNKAAINSMIQKRNGEENLLMVKDRKFEITELCRIFLGNRAAQLYTALVSFYLYLALWAYTSVFASALAKEIPIFGDEREGWDYTMFVGMFASLVVPLACRELNEQVTVQVTLAACRILMVTLMVVTVLLFPNDSNSSTDTIMAHSSTASVETSLPLFHFAGLYHSLPVIAYAFIFHHSIPGLSHPVGDKRNLKSIFKTTNIISALGYTFVGLCVGIYYGTGINQSSNLNWKDFRGGTGQMQMNLDDEGNVVDVVWVNVAWWAKAISHFIVSFPALDVASAFPLCAITLGNNLLDTFIGEDSETGVSNKHTRTHFRLIACFPPIAGALLIRELGIITDYAGAFGFIIAFTFPAVLYLTSKSKMSKVFGKDKHVKTYYQGYGSNDLCAGFISIFGIGMGIFVLVCLYQ